MKLYYPSILLVIISNTFYHLAQKGTPGSINTMVGLTVTYCTALVISIIGLELGFLLAYRSSKKCQPRQIYQV